MPIAGGAADFAAIGRAVGYKNVFTAGSEEELRVVVKEAKAVEGPVLIEVRAALGARDNLGRPTTTPKENRDALMRTLKREITMKAMILNSGIGKRMGELTKNKPKCMCDIGGGRRFCQPS